MFLLALLCGAAIALTVGYTWATTASAPPAASRIALEPLTSSPLIDSAPAPAHLAPEGTTSSVAPDEGDSPLPASSAAHEAVEAAAPVPRPAAVQAPLFLIRHTGIDSHYGALAAAVAGGTTPRQATTLQCERVHFAGGRGVCLQALRRAITTFSAVLFDATLQPTVTRPLSGIPSRTRVSPDGRYGATTVFVFGPSYAGSEFSTETQIFDAATGQPVVANLETMEVWADGSRLERPDFNLWGVTFARDSNRFYATLGTEGHTYLVAGDIAANRLQVIRDGVECPSLSPDETRVAFKKWVPGPGLRKWRLHVLDLKTLVDTPVAETRYIDEQVEWLDNANILYTQPDATGRSAAVTDVWVVPSDGSGQPSLLIEQAASPTVARREGAGDGVQ
jgi:hypothetical protein